MAIPVKTVLLSTTLMVIATTLLLFRYHQSSNGLFDFHNGIRKGIKEGESSILGEYIDEHQKPMWGDRKPWAHRTCDSHPDDIPDTGQLAT